VGLVDDDQPVGVLLGGDAARSAVSGRGCELLVGSELLKGDDLGREPGVVDRVLPSLLELRRTDDEREALSP
jgi:hypothetical protein